MSGTPVTAPPTAPKIIIIELPTKKATTVATTAIAGVLAKRVKFGVAVPPEMKEPTTIAMPAASVSGLSGFCAKTFIKPPTSLMPQLTE